MYPPARLSTQQLNRLHDRAHAEAAALHRAAMDAFWSATWRWLTEGRSKPASKSRGAAGSEVLSNAH
jgi:hypothetical protein